MDDQITELVAIGASVGAHCQPCLTYHVDRARELGIDPALIKAAVEVGQMVEKGAMAAMREFSGSVLGEPASVSAAGCCGGQAPGGKGCCCS